MIRDYYRDRIVLLTGGTGFYGQGLLAKMLRDLPEIRRIYVPIRSGKNKDGTPLGVEERLSSLFADAAVFARFRREEPEVFAAATKKVVAIECDMLKPGLGLEPEVRQRLEEELDIIISIAATVSFDDPLDHSLQLNTLGPQEMLELARAGKKKPVLVHVSTAYVNGRRGGVIAEEALPLDRDIKQLIDGGTPETAFDVEGEIAAGQERCRQIRQRAESEQQAEIFRREILEQSRSRQLSESRLSKLVDGHRKRWTEGELVREGMQRAHAHGWNDVYTFTKAMGEQLLLKRRGQVPLAIVRPAVTESSLADPEPGWIHGLKVTDPLVVAYGRGIVPDFPAQQGAPMDLVPIDIVINSIILAAPQASADEVRVYHAATSGENPLYNTKMFEYIKEYFQANPLLGKDGSRPELVDWTFPSVEKFRRVFRWRYLYPLEVRQWLLEKLPENSETSKKKRRLSALRTRLKRVLYFVDLFSPYTTLDCRFQMGKMLALYEALSPEEQQLFNVDVRQIDWEQYYKHTHLPGLRRHVLKGDGGVDPVFAGDDA
jgi:nucleoside-diphosphate-sugar epimerase